MSDAVTSGLLSSSLPSSLSPALTALLGGWKQTDRLLRLHTPLGADVLLAQELRAVECTSGQEPIAGVVGYRLQIDALSLDAHIGLKTLIGQPVLLEMMTDQHRSQMRPLHGYITQMDNIGSNGGMGKYRLTVEPWLAFLGATRDSAIYQDQSVLDILQNVLTDYKATYQGAGKLVPQWRLEIADPSVYAKRSLTTMYQESHLAFIQRLLLEEGLFYWFEHTGDAASAQLGSHTLVIADHNGAFKPLKHGATGSDSIRFSQSKGVIEGDTIDMWRMSHQWVTHAVEIVSWDYRTLSNRPVSQHAAGINGLPSLAHQDTPGAYAYESAAHGQRLASNQLQATQVAAVIGRCAGTVRTAGPGQSFTLTGHASHDGSNTVRDRFAILSVLHHAKNNLSAQLQAHAGQIPEVASSGLDRYAHSMVGLDDKRSKSAHSKNGNADVFYRNASVVIPFATPYRASTVDGHGQRIHPKPNVTGQQTALVIGVPGQHITTDRDHRVKVQFHWQRGIASSSRLAHPAPDGHSGAPAEDGKQGSSGTWVRVMSNLAPIAGANFGGVNLPRIGQEVVVDFIGGDIDRPVIVGAVYNGKGLENQQSNQVQAGGANATGNAPMWFPGDQTAQGKQGELPGHAHNAVLSGIKSQALSTSQTGTGGYNQLVFDDTPGQSRAGLHQHQAKHQGDTELNLGALRQQTDNQRLGTVGYGFELKTHFSGAIRAGGGMLVSADLRAGNESGASSVQLDSKEAINQLATGKDLMTALADTAQQHKTMLPVGKSSEVKPDKLPVVADASKHIKALQATASGVGGDHGGGGDATAYSEPHLVLSAPAGIALVSPESISLNAGATCSVTAQDINWVAGANYSVSVKMGISLFTYGKASNAKKPNQETGIKLHAASGKVSSQSQDSKTTVTADKSINVSSVTDAVTIQAPKHVLLTAQGAYIKLGANGGSDIEIHAPGNVDFKASMKNFTSAKSDSNSLSLPTGTIKNCPSALTQAASSQAGAVAL